MYGITIVFVLFFALPGFNVISEKITSFELDISSEIPLKTIDLSQNINQILTINELVNITFTCTANGNSYYVALYKKNEELKRTLQPDRNGQITVRHNIRSVQCTDKGEYSCRTGYNKSFDIQTRTILVHCPITKPISFSAGNINIENGSRDLTLECEKHENLKSAKSYEMLIRNMHGEILMYSHFKSSISYGFQSLECQHMGTYYCDTKVNSTVKTMVIDVVVHKCPPLLSKSKVSVKIDIGNSLDLVLNSTMHERYNKVTVYYRNSSVTSRSCSEKFCVDLTNSTDKWRKQINITILKITQQDFGQQYFKICTMLQGQLYCSNLTADIKPQTVCPSNVSVTRNESGPLIVSWTTEVLWKSFVIYLKNSSGLLMTETIKSIGSQPHKAIIDPGNKICSEISVRADVNENITSEKCMVIACPQPDNVINSADLKSGQSTQAKKEKKDFPLIPVVLAGAVTFVITSVLIVVLFKVKGKQMLKKQLKESTCMNGVHVTYTSDVFDAGDTQYKDNHTSVSYQPKENMHHTNSVTENGKTTTTEDVTFTTVGNTQVIKKVERTVIEEVRETVEIVNLDYSGGVSVTLDEDSQNSMNFSADAGDHTYSNVTFVSA